MNPLRPVGFHLAALAVGGLCAAFAWSREKTPLSSYESGAVVWSGRSSDVQRIVFETASRKLTLEAKDDGGQRWFYGSTQPLPLPSPIKPFPAVTAAVKLSDSLVPLRATRSLGKLES
jgi:Neuraminidase (sialidase)